jgi:hypothetical protein
MEKCGEEIGEVLKMNIMLWLLQRGFLLLAVQCLRNV